MDTLLLIAAAGLAASLVDGTLGMGFGPTSASILLASGVPPAAVSATVNIVKVASGVTGALFHWRLGNIDRLVTRRLAGSGALGAIIGVFVLTRVDGDQLRPILALFLLAVAGRMLWRFARTEPSPTVGAMPRPPRALPAVALAGGVTNGLIGAWGPVVTPYLLGAGMAPRFAIGSVNTAEVAVATVSAGALVTSFGPSQIDATLVAMLIGATVGAPIAARLIRHVPVRGTGLTVAALLLLTNLRELATWADLGSARWWLYAFVPVALATATIGGGIAQRRRSASTGLPGVGVIDQPTDAVG